MKRHAVLLALAPLVLAVAACSEDTKAQPRTAEVRPAGVTDPIDCGHLEATIRSKVDTSTEPPADEIGCMREALATSRAAEVTITRSTVEGDPIHETYRLGTDKHVALTIDSREDSFGGSGAGIQRVACTKPDWLPGAVCPPPPPPTSRPAPFTVAAGQDVTAQTRYVDVLVHPTHCTGSRTGTALKPTVDRTYGQVRVLFRVSNSPNNAGSCAGAPPIPARIDLRAPLGDRWIVDSSCIMPSVYWRDVCKDSKVRARAG